MWTEKPSNVVLDHGCKRYIYVVCEPYRRTYTHAQTKFSIEHTSVALAHARPTRYIQVPTTACDPTNLTTALSDWCSTSVRHHMTESQYVAILFDKPKLSL